MDIKELLQRYAAGERNFTVINLSYKNLTGIDLSEADLSKTYLR